jgi:Domain of unknown function (DUF4878)
LVNALYLPKFIKNYMKNLILIATFITTIILTSCGGGNSADPKEIARNFLVAMNKADYETAKKFGTDDTKKLLEMTSTFTAMLPDSVKKMSAAKKVEIIGEAKIDGEKAVVSYKESDSPEAKSLNLVKKDGKWLVQQSKDNPDASTPAVSDETVPATAEEAVPISTDSAIKK